RLIQKCRSHTARREPSHAAVTAGIGQGPWPRTGIEVAWELPELQAAISQSRLKFVPECETARGFQAEYRRLCQRELEPPSICPGHPRNKFTHKGKRFRGDE